jgi:hypothetical protein
VASFLRAFCAVYNVNIIEEMSKNNEGFLFQDVLNNATRQVCRKLKNKGKKNLSQREIERDRETDGTRERNCSVLHFRK